MRVPRQGEHLPTGAAAPARADMRTVLTHLGIDRAAVVGHDIGAMVACGARYLSKAGVIGRP